MDVKYTKPRLYNANNDLKKQWYVYFRFSVADGERRLMKISAGINRYPTIPERTSEARALITALNIKLNEGWLPVMRTREVVVVNHPERGRDYMTLIDWLDRIHRIKSVTLRPKSIRTYGDYIRIFSDWLIKNKLQKIAPEEFKASTAREFADFLLMKKYKATSFNHQICCLRTYFFELIEREIIQDNPFKRIKRLRSDQTSNFAFSKVEKEKVEVFLKKSNPRVYYATRFIYYCFIRRTELLLLQVKHINFTNMTISIPGSIAKNRKNGSVTIPRAMEGTLQEMKLEDADPQAYVFGYKFQTSTRRMTRPDNLTTAHNKALRKLKIRKECSLYGWKHTGVVALYQVTKDPYLVMRQCRHHDIAMTMIYLRSLGVMVDDKIRDAIY